MKKSEKEDSVSEMRWRNNDILKPHSEIIVIKTENNDRKAYLTDGD